MPRMKAARPGVKTTSLAAFAAQLRAWRERAGWTQVELGRQMGYSASLISGVETLDKPPTAEFAAACDRAFQTPGFDGEAGTPGTFMTVYELVAREAYPAFFAPVVPFERQAVRIHGWELGAVPGLLQTEEYARALISVSRPLDDATGIGRLVAARMDRQAILAAGHPPVLWYVIDEAVLRRVTGGPEVMAAQLDALLAAAAAPGIVIQALPLAGDNPGTDGPVSVYEFADAPAVCYTEGYAGGRIVEAPAEVAELVMVMGMLRASALPPRDSRELISQIRSELNDQ